MKSHFLLLSVLWMSYPESAAAQSLKVTGLTQNGNQVTITVQNTGASTAYRLESSPGMTAGTWSPVAGAVFSPVAGRPGTFSTTITRTVPGKLFYRVVGLSGTSEDPDGDGLSNTFENTLGTNPNLYDTDGDGYNDGVEYGFDTDPLLASSRPVFTDKATVNFVQLNSTATEGAGPHLIPVQFDRPFTGTVKFAVNSMGNARVGTDIQALSGTLSFSNATMASIPLNVVDDAVVSGQRAVILDLQINGNNYFIGGQGSHIVLINDNDSWWTGTLIPASGENASQIFRLKVTRQGGSTAATFGAGAGQDGLPVPTVATSPAGAPAITATSLSAGTIPEGSWPATVLADTPARFAVISPRLPSIAGSLFGGETYSRTLDLNAQPSLTGAGHPHLIQANHLIGDYREILSGTEIPLDSAQTAQSTTYGTAYEAGNATDRLPGTFTHTSLSDPAPSWTLTLPVAAPVSEIILHNRGDCCQERLRDITVTVFSDAGATVPVFTSAVLNAGNALNGPSELRVAAGGVNARVIRVARNSPAGVADRSILSLGEVKLLSTAALIPGSFYLVKDIPAPLPVLSNLVPTTP